MAYEPASDSRPRSAHSAPAVEVDVAAGGQGIVDSIEGLAHARRRTRHAAIADGESLVDCGDAEVLAEGGRALARRVARPSFSLGQGR